VKEVKGVNYVKPPDSSLIHFFHFLHFFHCSITIASLPTVTRPSMLA